jgi:hypothetical protein
MTTITVEYKKPNLTLVFILVIVLVAIIAFATLGTSKSHAVEKHGTKADLVRQCIDRGDDVLGVYQHSEDKQKELCLVKLGEKLYGIQIRANKPGGRVEEITAFVKEKLTKLEQVKNYIRNSGYIIGE